MPLWYYSGDEPNKVSLQKDENNCVAFLCCGGPSMAQITPSYLNGPKRVVLALNNSYPFVTPDIWMGMDMPNCYHRDIFQQPFMKILRGGYSDMLCEGQSIKQNYNMFYADVTKPKDKWKDKPNLPTDVKDIFRLRHGDATFVWDKNTLVVAIHLLIWMGFQKIYFFGCDLDNSDKDYHDSRVLSVKQRKWNKTLYKHLLKLLKILTVTGKKYGIEFLSCSKDSKINDFMEYHDYLDVIKECEKDVIRGKHLFHCSAHGKENKANKAASKAKLDETAGLGDE
jgi:hypothetical protein